MMMKKNRYYGFLLLILSIIILQSCEDQEIPIAEVQYLEANFMGTCFLGFYDKGYKEVIIRDEQSYQNFGDSIRIEIYNLDCSTATLPNIDFNNYFLVGKFTNGGGCSVTYDRQVIVDEENKKFIYKIDADYFGFCEMLIVNMNWALIPQKYIDYSIEFQVE